MKGNVLKLKNLPKNSPWCDKDEVMLYACFQLLVDFIEKEKPQKIVDYQHDSKQKKEWKELQALYRYWKRERPSLEKRITKLRDQWAKKYKSKFVPTPDGKYFEHVVLKNDKKAWAILHRAEDKFTKLENEMLQRLINARQHLWC
jgi:hypothetical protein